MNHTALKPRPADIERAARLITAAETECGHVFAPGYRRDLLCDNTVWSRDYIAKVVEAVAPPPPPNAVNVKKRLLFQKNGLIVVETRGENFVNTIGARDLRYRLEYKAGTTGAYRSRSPWVPIHGEFTDEVMARKALGLSNRNISYRLVAFNEIGWVALPKRWKGFCA